LSKISFAEDGNKIVRNLFIFLKKQQTKKNIDWKASKRNR